MRFLWVLAIASSALPAPVAPSPLVRILLPLYVAQPVQGAHDSLWQSQFVMHNGSPTRTYTMTTCPPNEICHADVTTDEELRPGETQIGLPARYPLPLNPVGGALVYFLPDLPLNQAEDVSFDLRIVDQSRTSTAAGTEVPVVRENEFRVAPLELLNIPTDDRFRLALRVFEMNLDHAEFSVRAIDQATNAVLSTHLVTTTAKSGGFVPGFVEIDDLSSGATAPSGYVRVSIEPLTAGAGFWSYVSITNNESQQITLVTPQ